MKKLYYSLFIFFLALTSCSDKEQDPSPENFIIGKWSYASVVYNGKRIPPGFTDEYNTRWVFNADNTYTRKLSHSLGDVLCFSEGTWEVTANLSKLILKDGQFGNEVVWDLVDVKNNFLKIRSTTSSKYTNTTTIAEFDMVHTD